MKTQELPVVAASLLRKEGEDRTVYVVMAQDIPQKEKWLFSYLRKYGVTADNLSASDHSPVPSDNLIPGAWYIHEREHDSELLLFRGRDETLRHPLLFGFSSEAELGGVIYRPAEDRYSLAQRPWLLPRNMWQLAVDRWIRPGLEISQNRTYFPPGTPVVSAVTGRVAFVTQQVMNTVFLYDADRNQLCSAQCRQLQPHPSVMQKGP